MIRVTNIVFSGLGGQGVVTTSDIFADAVFSAGFDVKKSDIHGMAQRGGSVSSDVRFGTRVLSPMIPAGEADYLVALDESRVDDFSHRLKATGIAIAPSWLDPVEFERKKSINVGLLALLVLQLNLAPPPFERALQKRLKAAVVEDSLRLFRRVTGYQVPCAGVWPGGASPSQNLV